VLSLAFHETFLGVVSLYRSRNETDFSEKDLFILNQVKEHLAYRLFTMHEIEVSSVSASEKKIPAALKQVNCDLTNREIEVFLLVLKGFSNNDIAERLFISEHTVKKHLKNLYKKLHVKSRIQLMQFQAAPAAVWQKS
ncbi:MAG: helix-turn-helix transcriptional regulator, partial [Spirochaetales bacterium]|nr:helix-turn-helix transcriptional regulator [Spirochaetales bacterium]